MNALSGGVFTGPGTPHTDELAELRALVDDIGARSAQARVGRRRLPEIFDVDAWRNLEETGLSRLISDPESGAGPTESAVLLRGLARHAVAVPVAESDLLAAWLARAAGFRIADTGPLSIAMTDGEMRADRITGSATGVPWTRSAATVVLAVRRPGRLLVGTADPHSLSIIDGHNLGGEPRDIVEFDLPADEFTDIDPDYADELNRRGAWARCVQCIGALDSAAELSVAHTRERVQFGRPLSNFQAVQHALAQMAGEIERARAATELAVAAAADYGFGNARTDYGITVAKVALGRVVPTVSTIAHQLHGAIGVTIEHPLWSSTNRAHSWIDEFGSTGHHARRLGRIALDAQGDTLWDVLTTGP